MLIKCKLGPYGLRFGNFGQMFPIEFYLIPLIVDYNVVAICSLYLANTPCTKLNNCSNIIVLILFYVGSAHHVLVFHSSQSAVILVLTLSYSYNFLQNSPIFSLISFISISYLIHFSTLLVVFPTTYAINFFIDLLVQSTLCIYTFKIACTRKGHS